MSEIALDGIRVLDVSTALAGPVTATMLGDFGADVVKVEEPGRGDAITRGRSKHPGGRTPQWAQESRNKQSVALNLRTKTGQHILREMVPHFDVVVTNYRPPTLQRWGLGPEDLSRLNPDAVLLYLTGYGMTGPYRNKGAFDRVASAFSGLTYVSGEAGRTPTRTGFSVIDYMSSYLAAFSVMMALYHRDVHGGGGQVIDLALYEAAFRASEDALLEYALSGSVRERTGNSNPYIVPASDYTDKHGRFVSVHAGTDQLFHRLVKVMGRPDLSVDSRFATYAARRSYQQDLYSIIATWMASHDTDEIVAVLTHADIPCSPVMNIADIANDPHYLERGTIVTVDDAEFGTIPMAAPLPHMSKTPGHIRTLGPRLGEHTEAVLRELLGFDSQRLADLRTDGVIGIADTPPQDSESKAVSA